MWLYPWVHRIARAAAGIYYRMSPAGRAVPGRGPVLLIANHPNALLDPILVAAAARRPVRFLAKAPLFRTPVFGRLVRSAGSIPVYRQQDDPTATGRNSDSLREAHAALAGGTAVAIFPEGISHDEPALSPLKTGAARIALGAAALAGGTVPVMPLGIVLREKERFRSEALVVVGDPIRWDDLAGRGADDVEAARELTIRMDAALRDVTVNLEHWTDRPIVECAEAIWASKYGISRDGAERIERIRVATDLLYRIRRDPQSRYSALVAAVTRHARSLRRLGLAAADLDVDLGNETALWWSLRRIPLVMLPAIAVAAAGGLLWWLPYRLTGLLTDRIPGGRDVRSTHKLLGGFVVYLAWLVLLAWYAAGSGTLPVLTVLVGAPALGIAGLWVRERWLESWADARRFFLLRRRPYLLKDLRRRQHEIAERLDALFVNPG
jgi:glycerol-3-phosphate O-acyltransferase/dihydroxyacetone phosphate acyltransferase